MTDDFSRELEEIAKIFSTNPRGLSELRELIASLPSPSPLTLPGASETSLPTTETQVNDLSSGPASSAGVAGTTGASSPGSISGGAIIPGTLQANAFASSIRPIQMVDGPALPTLPDANFPVGSVVFNLDDGRLYRNDADMWHTVIPETDVSNGMLDPTMGTIPQSPYDLPNSDPIPGMSGFNDWSGRTTIYSGTHTVLARVDTLWDRVGQEHNPFASAFIELDTARGTAALDSAGEIHERWLYGLLSPIWTDLPYVVAAVQIIDLGPYSSVEGDYTDVDFTLEICEFNVDTWTFEGVKAYQTVDVSTLPADIPVQVWCAFEHRGAAYTYFPRFRIRANKGATAAAGYWVLGLGEPQVHFAGTPDPASYTPAIAHWRPDSFEHFSDYVPEQHMSINWWDGLTLGYVLLAPARNPRNLTGDRSTWLIKSNYSGPDAHLQVTGSLLIGYPSYVNGVMQSSDLRLRRSTTKEATFDDGANGAALFNVQGRVGVDGLPVLGPRNPNWVAPTGTAQRTTFATDTVTLINLARAVKALIDDLTTHGLIGVLEIRLPLITSTSSADWPQGIAAVQNVT